MTKQGLTKKLLVFTLVALARGKSQHGRVLRDRELEQRKRDGFSK
ncbi:MAG: hypothetical protein Q7R45_00155 [Sulfuricaulis sp.]|nr:hypothetical protein [Sulfuricaulis sp.]